MPGGRAGYAARAGPADATAPGRGARLLARRTGGASSSTWIASTAPSTSGSRPRLVKVGLTGALHLGPSVEFSEGPQAPTTSDRGALEPDEFHGLAATRPGVGLTWSQQTGSVDHLMFRRVPLSAWR